MPSHPPRPTPAQLAAHHCGLGHRLGRIDHPIARFVCVDCAARMRVAETGEQRWQWDVLPWTNQRPPCAAKEG
jgi:hypothetical protein